MIAFALGAAVLLGSCLGIRHSQLFAINTVEVVGVARLTADVVRARAAVPAGSTLLRYPADEIERRLLADPWIADVQLTRDFPSTLRIRIEERTPAAIVDTGEAFWLVDSSGVVLARETLEETGTAHVVIRDIAGFEPVAGRQSTADGLRNALEILRGLDPTLRANVRAISSPTVDETALIMADSMEIMIGEAVRLEEKSAIIVRILTEQAGTIVFIDVRIVERPISRGLGE